MNKYEIESTALQLKALLKVLSEFEADTDHAAALIELPHALKPAADLAENLYCAIVNME